MVPEEQEEEIDTVVGETATGIQQGKKGQILYPLLICYRNFSWHSPCFTFILHPYRDSSRDDGGGRERDSRRERDSKGIASGDRGGGTSGGSGAGGRERSRDRAIIRESSRKRESKPFNRDRSGTR